MKSGFRILVVDDDEMSQFVVSRLIPRVFASAEVISVHNGLEAVNHLLGDTMNLPTLIMLDIDMPGMDGFEFLEWHSRSTFRGRYKIVVCTSSVNWTDKRRAMDSTDVIAYITKPLSLEVMCEIRDKVGYGALL